MLSAFYVLFTHLIAPCLSYAINSPTGHAVVSQSGLDELVQDERTRERRSPSFFPTYNQFPNWLIASVPPNEFMKLWITNEHNRYRRLVPATDMRMMYWSDELAMSAQRHANRCDFRHSRDRVNVGENIWAAPFANYSEAVGRWFDEVYDPRCQCKHAYKHCCGHYVQVVWARSNLVGCGYARCRDVWGVEGRGHRHVFVCHYNPQGNTVFVTGNGQLFAVPAFTWASNDKQRCSECPSDAPACYKGLCYMPSSGESPPRILTQSNNDKVDDVESRDAMNRRRRL
ncbi:Protein lon-1 [Toxocara canis]|uniref:Protein lon-1 n=1 Tax=Toxocara canis TaxID=6265 RepID=A0A0B2VH23_TOXCA|nr:Protein lon-1 [Toxocara canis]